jgi:hypothetical protein
MTIFEMTAAPARRSVRTIVTGVSCIATALVFFSGVFVPSPSLDHPAEGLAAVAVNPGGAMFEDDRAVFAAMRAGARGYVLKGARHAELLRAIRAAGGGEAIFSPTIAGRLMEFFASVQLAATGQVFLERFVLRPSSSVDAFQCCGGTPSPAGRFGQVRSYSRPGPIY